MWSVWSVLLRNSRRLSYVATAGVVFFGAGGYVAGQTFPRYEARVYIRFHALQPLTYTQMSFLLTDSRAVRECFAPQIGEEKVQDAAQRLLADSVLSAGHIRSMVTQVYPTGRISQSMGDQVARRGVGLVVATSGGDPATIKNQVLALSECIAQLILITGLNDLYADQLNKTSVELVRQNATIAELSQGIAGAAKNVKGLSELASKYPSVPAAETQFLDGKGETVFHMPLAQQIVAAESRIVASTQALASAESSRKQLELLIDYYDRAYQESRPQKRLPVLMQRLQNLRSQIFTSGQLKNPLIADALQSLLEAERRQSIEHSAQISSVEVSKKFGGRQGMQFGVLVGLLLAGLYALLVSIREAPPATPRSDGAAM